MAKRVKFKLIKKDDHGKFGIFLLVRREDGEEHWIAPEDKNYNQFSRLTKNKWSHVYI